MLPIVEDSVKKFVSKIPKVELHVHLEGAIPLETLLGLIQKNAPLSTIKTVKDLERKFHYTDFLHFLDIWRWKDRFITDERDFEEIAYQVLRKLHAQNVKYVEAFYAPGGYLEQDLNVGGITENLIAGKERAYQDFGIRCELIIDLIRQHGPEKGMFYLDEATPYLGKGLIGVGLGGSECEFPPELSQELYHEAKQRGFHLTAHAGEAAGADSVWGAIKSLSSERIGHGLRSYEDPELLSFFKEHQIPLEMCVVSNVRTGVCPSLKEHPIKQYFDQGLMVTVNSDDPVMFNTSINQEYQVLYQQHDFTLDELQQMSLNGIVASFLPEEEKQDMKNEFEQEWQHIYENYANIDK